MIVNPSLILRMSKVKDELLQMHHLYFQIFTCFFVKTSAFKIRNKEHASLYILEENGYEMEYVV